MKNRYLTYRKQKKIEGSKNGSNQWDQPYGGNRKSATGRTYAKMETRGWKLRKRKYRSENTIQHQETVHEENG